MTEINRSAPVLVTGAAGYVASWIVRYLLEDGHTVHGTVRSLSDFYKLAHLHELEKKTPGKLRLFEADLLDAGAFAEAMQGCELVIHTASPFQIKVKRPKLDLVDPALLGTRHVLQSANEIPTVKRVVQTSSVAAVMGDAIEVMDTVDGIFNEDDWNLTSDLNHRPYAYSKTLAEKEAWRIYQEQNRWDLLTINPAFVLGPSLSRRTDNFSTGFMLDLVRGKMRWGLPDIYRGVVDVREVARAHLKAGFIPSAAGRHVLSARVVPLLDLCAELRAFFGRKYPLPRRVLPDWLSYLVAPVAGFSWRYLRNNLGYDFELDASYSVRDLGLTYRPIRETLVDQVKDFEAKGLV